MKRNLTDESTQIEYDLAVMLDFVGDRLLEWRIRHKLNQDDVADILRIPQAHISQIENGKLDLRLSTILMLATFFDDDPNSWIPTRQQLRDHAWRFGAWGIKRLRPKTLKGASPS